MLLLSESCAAQLAGGGTSCSGISTTTRADLPSCGQFLDTAGTSSLVFPSAALHCCLLNSFSRAGDAVFPSILTVFARRAITFFISGDFAIGHRTLYLLELRPQRCCVQ